MNSDEILQLAEQQRTERKDAKRWLKRVYYQTLRVEAEERALRVIEGRVNNAVGKMETDGSGVDRDQSNKRREDALIDYVQKKADLEAETLKLAKLKHDTRQVLGLISDERLRVIAERRYIDCLDWRDVEKVEAYCHSHMMRLHVDILNSVAAILKREEAI